MDIHKENIAVQIMDTEYMVSLKWYRGASRYNNGATRYKRKYLMRLIISRAKELTSRKYDKGTVI